MAKLDFFARYPDFFEAARGEVANQSEMNTLESAMVRHHYGPWDKRYYHVLAHLEAKSLITVSKEGRAYRIGLTDLGIDRAKHLTTLPSFATLVTRMKEIKATFGRVAGSTLKNMIYKMFDREVGQRPLGERIQK
jgi:hypothetical protein